MIKQSIETFRSSNVENDSYYSFRLAKSKRDFRYVPEFLCVESRLDRFANPELRLRRYDEWK